METKASEPRLKKGQPAPAFDLLGTDGMRHSLAAFSDYKALLVVFVSNAEPYSRAKIPILNDLSNSYEDLAVVGINANHNEYPGGTEEDTMEKMREYVAGDHWYIEEAIDYDVYLRDENQHTARLFGARCTPDPYLFKNVDGTFRLAYHGRIDDAVELGDDPTEHYVERAIESILQDDPVEIDFRPSIGHPLKWGVVADHGIHRAVETGAVETDELDSL